MLCRTVRILCLINIAAILVYVVTGLLSQIWGKGYVIPLILTCLLPISLFARQVWEDRPTWTLLQIACFPVFLLFIGFFSPPPGDQ